MLVIAVILMVFLGTYLQDLIRDFIEFLINIVTYTVHAFFVWMINIFSGHFMIGKDMFDSTEIGGLISTFHRKFIIIGIALLVLIASWQIFKSFFGFMGLNTDIEEAWKIGLKMMVFGFLIIYSLQVCKVIVTGPMLTILDIIFSVNVNNMEVVTGVAATYSDSVTSIGTAISNVANMIENNDSYGLAAIFTGSNLILAIIRFVVTVFVDYKMFKFIITMAQKYINMVIFIIISPVAFACGVSKATSSILKGWVKLFTGSFAIQLIQYLLLKMVFIYYNAYTVSSGAGVVSVTELRKLFFVYIAMIIILDKSESLLEEIGLPPGPKETFSNPINYARRIRGLVLARSRRQ